MMYWHTESEVKACSAEVQSGNKMINNSKHYSKLDLVLNKMIFKQLK